MSEKRKKRLLIIWDMVGMEGGQRGQIFQREYPDLDAEVDEVGYGEIVVEMKKPEEIGKIWLKNGKVQEDYDVTYMRATGGSELAVLLGKVAGRDFWPKFYVNKGYTPSKALQAFNLAKAGLPEIATVSGYGAGLLNYMQAHEEEWPGETIIKPNIGAKGRGVQKAANRAELREILKAREKEFLVWQPVIKCQGEGRCLVLGREVKWSAWRNGETRKLEKWAASEEIKQLALQAASANGLELAGVDVIFDEEEQIWKILEVNTAPGFRTFDAVTGERTDELMMKYLLETRGRG